MKADLIKRCVRALAEAGDGNFDGLCEQLIQEEQRKGHRVGKMGSALDILCFQGL
jgi:hypothetical protein